MNYREKTIRVKELKEFLKDIDDDVEIVFDIPDTEIFEITMKDISYYPDENKFIISV